MPALPDVYYVPPWPEPGECGVVSFIREVARQVWAHAGPVARPVSVLGMAASEQRPGDPRRWTVVHLLLADGSHVVFTARPHPVAVADDEWSVWVNRRFVGVGELVPGGRVSERTGPGHRPVTVVRPRAAAGAPP